MKHSSNRCARGYLNSRRSSPQSEKREVGKRRKTPPNNEGKTLDITSDIINAVKEFTYDDRPNFGTYVAIAIMTQNLEFQVLNFPQIRDYFANARMNYQPYKSESMLELKTDM
jgi:hypothetical protein